MKSFHEHLFPHGLNYRRVLLPQHHKRRTIGGNNSSVRRSRAPVRKFTTIIAHGRTVPTYATVPNGSRVLFVTSLGMCAYFDQVAHQSETLENYANAMEMSTSRSVPTAYLSGDKFLDVQLQSHKVFPKNQTNKIARYKSNLSINRDTLLSTLLQENTDYLIIACRTINGNYRAVPFSAYRNNSAHSTIHRNRRMYVKHGPNEKSIGNRSAAAIQSAYRKRASKSVAKRRSRARSFLGSEPVAKRSSHTRSL